MDVCAARISLREIFCKAGGRLVTYLETVGRIKLFKKKVKMSGAKWNFLDTSFAILFYWDAW